MNATLLLGDFGVNAASYDGGAWSPYLAELSTVLKRSVEKWGERGKVTLPDLLRMPRLPFAFAVAALLAAGLFFLQRAFPR